MKSTTFGKPFLKVFALFFAFIVFSSSASVVPSVFGPYIKDIYLYGNLNLDLVSQWTMMNLVNPSSSTRYQTIGTYSGMGGPGLTSGSGYWEKNYTGLPSHTQINLVFYTYMWDTWLPTDSVTVSFDGIPVQTFYPVIYKVAPYILTAGTHNVLLFRFVGNVTHTASTLSLRFTINVASTSTATFGINDINMILKDGASATNICATWGVSADDPGSGYTCPCNVGAYRDSTGTCVQGCHGFCYHCYGPLQSQCYQCRSVGTTRTYSNGLCQDNAGCIANCVECNAATCYLCKSGYYLRWDGTCATSCPTGYSGWNIGNYYQCDTPCQASDRYMMTDNSCSSTCEYPFTSRTVGKAKFCDFPCNYLTQIYRFSDGQCVSTCPNKVIRSQGNYRFCDDCAAGTYSYEDGSCKSTCSSLMIKTPQSVYTLCKYPCPNNEFLYADNTCSSECSAPYQKVDQDGVMVCNHPCSYNVDYYYNPHDKSCTATCASPYKTYTDNTVKVCRTACEYNGTYALASGHCVNACGASLVARSDGTAKFCEVPGPTWWQRNRSAMAGLIAFGSLHVLVVLYILFKRFMAKYRREFQKYAVQTNISENTDATKNMDVTDAEQSPELSTRRMFGDHSPLPPRKQGF